VLLKPSIDAALVLRSLAGVLMLVAVGLLVYKAADLLERPVREVTVNGDFRHLQQDHVKQAVAPFIDNDYLTVPLVELRASLEALPWVYQAEVKRDWPDGLVIAVQEQKPIAWWGKDQLINNKGQLFAPDGASIEESLPYLEGPVGSQEEVIQRYIDLGKVLGSRNLALQSMRLSERGSWSFALKSEVELVFGRDRVMEKLQRFLAIYDLSLNKYLTDIKRIDLRYQNGLAVEWLNRPGSKSEVES
jgi:cell division protein FtsQ